MLAIVGALDAADSSEVLVREVSVFDPLLTP
jgi:hypothetical protein